MTTGQHKTLASPPPYRNAVVVIAIAIGLVGSPAEQPALLAALKRATHGGLAILGFVTMFQLRANAPGLKFRDWLAAIAMLAIAGGLVLAVVVDPLIGALHGPFPELWLALAAEVAVTALFCSTMLVLVGR